MIFGRRNRVTSPSPVTAAIRINCKWECIQMHRFKRKIPPHGEVELTMGSSNRQLSYWLPLCGSWLAHWIGCIPWAGSWAHGSSFRRTHLLEELTVFPRLSDWFMGWAVEGKARKGHFYKQIAATTQCSSMPYCKTLLCAVICRSELSWRV